MNRKLFKRFSAFYWSFLGIITCIVVPCLVAERNYQKLCVFFIIFTFLVVLSISLYVFLLAAADAFTVSNRTVTFIYPNKRVEMDLDQIKEIRVCQYHYIFVANKRIRVSRLRGTHTLEKDVDTRIAQLSAQGVAVQIKKRSF